MTHTLILLRHAKAESPLSGQRDADRPLSPQGHADALAAGQWINEADLSPALVLCSPARRTVQTWQAVARMLGTDADGSAAELTVTFDQRLYTHNVETILDLVFALPDDLQTVMIIGHNPAVSLMSALLNPPFNGHMLRTAGLAVHRAEAPWQAWRHSGAPLALAHTGRAVAV